MKTLLIFLLLTGAERFVVLHNHPGGVLIPSETDIETKFEICRRAYELNFTFEANIIVSDEGFIDIINDTMEDAMESMRKE